MLYIFCLTMSINYLYIEASDPKWVNSVLKTIGVNSLRLWGIHMLLVKLCCILSSEPKINIYYKWRPPSLSKLNIIGVNLLWLGHFQKKFSVNQLWILLANKLPLSFIFKLRWKVTVIMRIDTYLDLISRWFSM